MNKIITINNRKVDNLLVYLVVLMDCNFFYLYRIPGFLSKYWGLYIKFLPIVVAGLHLLIIKGWTVRNKFLKLYTVLLTISFFSVSFFSCAYYVGESVRLQLILYGTPFFVFFAFPLLKKFQRDNGCEKFLEGLNIVACISYLLTIIQALIYETTGLFYLQIGHSTRNGSVRITLSGLANYMVVYNICRMFSNKGKKKIFNIIQVVLGLIVVFLIEQTRAFEIAILLAFGVVILFYNSGNQKQILFIVLAIIAVFVAIEMGVVDKFLESFSSGGETDTAQIRVEGYLYFLQEFLRNPLWGHGFTLGSQYRLVRTGPLGHYYYADTGVVGAMAQMGIFIIPIYIMPIVYWGIKLFKNRKDKNRDIFILSSYIFILSLSPTLYVLNAERCIIWGIFMALFAYSERTESDLYVDKRLLWFG